MAKYALLCGVNEYENGSFRMLNYGINDAVKMKSLLDLCDYETVLLAGKDLTNTALFDGVTKLAEKALPGDTLLFFFSGHGCSYKKDQFVLPVNAKPAKKGPVNGARLSKIAKLMDKPGIERIFIIDACRDLLMTKGGTPLNTQPLTQKGMNDDIPKGKSRLGIVCACSDGQFSHESARFKGGYFTAMLLQTTFESIETGKQLTLMQCAHDVDQKLKALPAIIKESVPLQPPWVQGENLILHDGTCDPVFSVKFYEKHQDIESEYVNCDLCGSRQYFLDMRYCLLCEQTLCSSHFFEDDIFCNLCCAKRPEIIGVSGAMSLNKELAHRQAFFEQTLLDVFPHGIIMSGGNPDNYHEIYEKINSLLFSHISAKHPGTKDLSGIKADMVIQSFFGLSPLLFTQDLHMRRYYNFESSAMLSTSCREHLKGLVAFGRPSRPFADRWTEIETPYFRKKIEPSEQIKMMCDDQIAKLKHLLNDLLEGFEKKKKEHCSKPGDGIILIANNMNDIEYEINKLALKFFNIGSEDLVTRRTTTYTAFGFTSALIGDVLVRVWAGCKKDSEISRMCECTKKAFGVASKL